MMKPTMRNFQDVIGSAAGANRHCTRLVVGHELNVDRDAAFVDKFAT